MLEAWLARRSIADYVALATALLAFAALLLPKGEEEITIESKRSTKPASYWSSLMRKSGLPGVRRYMVSDGSGWLADTQPASGCSALRRCACVGIRVGSPGWQTPTENQAKKSRPAAVW